MKKWFTSLIWLICFTLMLSTIKAITTDQIFPKLEDIDKDKLTFEFEMDLLEAANKEQLTAYFDSRCGEILGYHYEEYKEVTSQVPYYTYKQIIDENGTEKSVISGLAYNEVIAWKWVNVGTLPSGKHKYKAVIDSFKMDRCLRGWGYWFDWQPVFTDGETEYKQKAWVWANSSWKYRRVLNFNYAHALEPLIYNLTAVCGGECNANHSDIRLYDNDTSTYIDYEFLNSTYRHTIGTNASFIQAIIPNTSHVVYVYYGNPTALEVDTVVINFTYVFEGDKSDFTGSMYVLDTNEILDDGIGNTSLLVKTSGTSTQINVPLDRYLDFFVWDYYNSTTNRASLLSPGVASGNYYLFLGHSSCSGATQFCFMGGGWNDMFGRQKEVWQNIKINWTPSTSHAFLHSNETEGSLPALKDTNTDQVAVNVTAWVTNNQLAGGLNEFFIDRFRSSYLNFNQYFTPNIPSVGAQESENTAPNINNVTVIPASPSITDYLNCSAVATDVESINLSIDFWWHKNGVIHAYNSTVNTTNNTLTYTTVLVPPVLGAGDNWTCYARAYDFDDYSTVKNDTVTISNVAPTVVNTTITPQSPITTDSLNCSGVAQDFENSTLDMVFFWHKNGVIQDSYNDTEAAQVNTTEYTAELVNETLIEGDNWTCFIKVWDGGTWSALDNDTVQATAAPAPIVYNQTLTCDYNPNPNIKFLQKINWLCQINCSSINCTTWRCYSQARFNSDVVQINPKQEFIPDIGLVDYFIPQPPNSNYQYVNVYFTTSDLRHDQNLTFEVVCAGDNEILNFAADVTPVLKAPIEVADYQIWAIENAAYLVGFVFIFILCAFIIYAAWYASRTQ